MASTKEVSFANNKTEGPAGPGLESVREFDPKSSILPNPGEKRVAKAAEAKATADDEIASPIEIDTPVAAAREKNPGEKRVAKAAEAKTFYKNPKSSEAVLTQAQTTANKLVKELNSTTGTTRKRNRTNNGTGNTLGLPSSTAPSTAITPSKIYQKLTVGLPTLLRFGPYDATSEYIELDTKKDITKEFNQFGYGLGRNEMETFYGITDISEIAVLQKVFGIKSIGKSPLFSKYSKDKCKFDGVAIVKKALKNRIKSLQEQITKEGSTNVSNRYKHQLEWFQQIIGKIDTYNNPCEEEEQKQQQTQEAISTQSVGVGTNARGTNIGVGTNARGTNIGVGTNARGTNIGVGSNASGTNVGVGSNASGKNTSSVTKDGCPCLTDIHLLRDLVYLVSTVRDTATDDIKQKMSQIPLQKLLNSARSNTPQNLSKPTKEILILLLEHLMSVQKDNSLNKKNIDPKILLQIYQIFNKTDARTSISLGELLIYLETVAKQLQSVNTQKTEVDKLRAEIASLQKKLEDCTKVETTNTDEVREQLKKALAELEQLRKDHDLSKKQLLESHKPEGSAEELLRENNSEEIEALNTQIRNKNAEIIELQSQLQSVKNNLEGEKASLSGELAAINAALKMEKEQHAKCVSEKERLQVEYEGLESALDEINKKGASNSAASAAISDELKKLQDSLGEKSIELAAKNAEISDLSARLAESEAKIPPIQKQIEEKDTTISNLRQELLDAKDKISVSSKDLDAARGNIAKCTVDLSKINAEKNELEAQLKAKEAELAALQKEHQEAKNQLASGFKPNGSINNFLKNGENDKEKKDLKAKLAALQKEHDDAKQQLANSFKPDGSINNFLKNGENDKEKKDLKAKLAALQKEHDDAKQQLANSFKPDGSINNFLKNGENDKEKKELKAKLAALQKEHDKAKQQLANSFKPDGSINNFLKNGENDKEKKDLKAKLAALQKEHDDAKQQLANSFKPDHEEIEEKLEKLTAEKAQLELQLKNKNSEIARISGELQNATQELETIQELLESERASHAAEVEGLTVSIKMEKEKHTKCVSEKEKLQDDYEALEGALDELNKKKSSSKNASDAMSAELKKLQDSLGEKGIELSAKDVEISDLSTRLASESSKLEDLNKQVSEKDETIAGLRTELEAAKTELTGLRVEHEAIQAALHYEKEQYQKCKASEERLQLEYEGLERTVDDLNKTKQASNTVGTQFVTKLQGLLENTKKELRAKQDELSKALENLQASNARILLLQGQIDGESDEHTQRIVRHALAQGQLKKRSEELEEIRKERDLLREELELLQTKKGVNSGSQTNSVQEPRGRLHILTIKVKTKQREIDELRKQLAASKNDLGRIELDLQAEQQGRKRDLDKLGGEFNDLLAQLNSEKEQRDASDKERDRIAGEYAALQAKLAEKNISNTLSSQLDTLQKSLEAKDAELAEQAKKVASSEARYAELETKIRLLEGEIAVKDNTIAVLNQQLEQTKSELNDEKAISDKLRARISELESKEHEFNESLGSLQQQLSEAASSNAELVSLRSRIAELQEKAGRVNAAEASLAEVSNQLSTVREDLRKCNESEIAKQAEHDSTVAELRRDIEAEQEKIRGLEARLATTTGLESELATAMARIQALEAELAGLQSSGSKATDEFTDARKGYEARIAELEKQHRDLTKKTGEDKETAIAEEKKKCDTRISEIQEQLDDMKAQLIAARAEADKVSDLEARLVAANIKISEHGSSAAGLDATLKEVQEQLAAAQAEASKVSSLDTTITELKAQLAAANAARSACDTELAEARRNASEQRARANAAEAAGREKNSIIEIQKEELDKLRRIEPEFEQAKATIEDLQRQLADFDTLRKEHDVLEQTKQRLENLIGLIAISPEQKEILSNIVSGEITKIDANVAAHFKKSNTPLSDEICNFLRYLYETINIQKRILDKSIQNEDLINNIFTIYRVDYSNIDDLKLLDELTTILHIYTGTDTKTGIPSDGIPIQGEFSELLKVFKTKNFTYKINTITTTKLRSELSQISLGLRNGYLDFDTMKIIGKREFLPSEIKDNSIPLAILAIKFIQLLYTNISDKYENYKEKCGYN
uniref:Uncharacterized protein n=1 Tax=viral metagenome TaxID=1070528 RepID=A0A6C0HF21_9ZZZZ